MNARTRAAEGTGAQHARRSAPTSVRRPAERLAQAVVPEFADFAAIHLADWVLTGGVPERPAERRVAMRRVAVTGSSRSLHELLPEGRLVRWVRDTPVLLALARGEPVQVTGLDSSASDHLADQLDLPGLANVLYAGAALLLPLVDSGNLIGVALLISASPFPQAEAGALAAMARWAAEATGSALNFQVDLAMIERLHRAVLPPRTLVRPGLDLALSTRSPGPSSDWCEAIALPEDRTALVIGDVNGLRSDAAVHTIQLRAYTRALATVGLSPAELLQRLDTLVRELDDSGELLATCLYAVFDPVTNEFRVANAGQVTPILIRPNGHAELLSPRAAAPLGTGVADYETRIYQLPPRSLLLLGTKGLTLRTEEPGESGIAGGPDGVELVGLPGGSADLGEVCDEMLAGVGERDAVALLVARLGGAPEKVITPEPYERPVPEPLEVDGELVGRTEELAEVRRLLTISRLVTLSGGAGVGKSRLIRAARTAVADDFPDGVRLVSLGGLRDPGLIPQAVAAALDGDTLAELTDRRMLLILDGIDRLIDDCALFTRSLLRAAPQVRVLTSSRQPLRITGEHVLALAPLGLEAAVTLFAVRAAEVCPGFPRTASEGEAARRLCARLDGVPLTLEIAAGRLAHQSIEELAEAFTLLGDENDSSRDLRAAVGWSHELCSPQERLLWARLSVFAGRFDLDAVEFVCADEMLPREDILPLLSALVQRSVVIRELDVMGPRYRLLQTVREFGHEHLSRLPELHTITRLHDDWTRMMIDQGL